MKEFETESQTEDVMKSVKCLRPRLNHEEMQGKRKKGERLGLEHDGQSEKQLEAYSILFRLGAVCW